MAFDPHVLMAVDFVDDPEARLLLEREAQQKDLHRGGMYAVVAVMKKDLVTVVVERNVTTEVIGGLQTQITHPEVAKISGPSGATACAADDSDLVLAMAEAMA